MMELLLRFLKIFMIIPILFGCAKNAYFYKKDIGFIEGSYHKILKGETLWGISQYYGIALKEIARWNKMKTLDKIHANQLLFIPISVEKLSVLKKKRISFKGDELSMFELPVKFPIYLCKKFLKEKGFSFEFLDQKTVVAAASGNVVFSGRVKNMGHVVLIQHKKGYTTVYGHLEKGFVQQNDWIEKGKPIGILKKRHNKKKSLLRFEIRKEGMIISPFSFFYHSKNKLF